MSNTSNLCALYKKNMYKFLISPLTYLIAIVMVAYCIVQFFIGQQFFTISGSTDMRLFFQSIPYICIIAIPSLLSTIGFKDDELNTPGASIIIPASKLLSSLAVLSAVILLTAVVPVAVSFFGRVDLSQILCGYFGIILYLASTLSISIFLFTVIKSSGGAFIATALILAVTNSAHLIPLYVKLPAFLSSFCKSISYAWHFDSAAKGIVDTRDVLFYLDSSLLFTLLTSASIEFKRGEHFSFSNKRSSFFTKSFILSILVISFIFADNSLLYKRIDTTSSKKFTVSEYSKTLLSEVEEPLSVTYYLSKTLKELYPQVRDVQDFLEAYCSENKKISFSEVDPSSKTSKQKDSLSDISSKLQSYGISPQQIQTAGRDSTSYTTVYSAVVISYLEKIEVIDFVLNTSTLEYDVTSRISSLVRNTKRKVQLVAGNGLSLENDYTYVKPYLESQGFEVSVMSLPLENIQNIPLVVLGTSQFSPSDSESLERFILNNGSAFICATPYSVDINGDWSVAENSDKVCRLLRSWGVNFKSTLTADISNFRITMVSDTDSSGNTSKETRTEYINYPLWPVLRPQTYALNGMTTFWPCAISYSTEDSNILPLLVTSPASWQVEKIDGKFQTNPFTIPQSPENKEKQQSEVVCLSLQGKLPGYYTTGYGNAKDVVVLADQYALSTMMLSYSSQSNGDFRSLDFLTDRLLEEEGLGQILPLKNKNYTSTSLYKATQDELSGLKFKTIFICISIPLFILIIIFATVFIYRKQFNSNCKKSKRINFKDEK